MFALILFKVALYLVCFRNLVTCVRITLLISVVRIHHQSRETGRGNNDDHPKSCQKHRSGIEYNVECAELCIERINVKGKIFFSHVVAGRHFRSKCLNHLEIYLTHLEISLNHLEISLIHLEIFLNHLEINRFRLNLNYGYATVVGKDHVLP